MGVLTPGTRTRKEPRTVGDGLVPSRRAVRARIENAPHSRDNPPMRNTTVAGDHNAPARAHGRPDGTGEVDVIIVGAGLSGIGAACHLQRECPDRSFVILEARDTIGGTWDLFRYPGVRSDSDMHTLGYDFKPWTDAKAIADGPAILRYVQETARENDLMDRIRFGHRVRSARWSSDEARWTVAVDRGGDGTTEISGNFLYLCGGYYEYEAGPRAPLRRPGALRRSDPASPVLAGVARLQRRARRHHRQRRHRHDAGTGDGRERRIGYDGAAFPDVRHLPARRGCPRQPLAPVAPRAARLRHHALEEHHPAGPLLPANPRAPGEGQEPATRPGSAPPRPGLRSRDALHAALQPLGPAALPDSQRRSLPCHQVGRPRGRDRSDRTVHRTRDQAGFRARVGRGHHRAPRRGSSSRSWAA